ncbi:MAG: alpha-mannosidase [Lachnospiraceae bacterium]|jgi:alpha-mannosidase
MNLMNAEMRDRIAHWIRTLKQDFYEPLGEIPLEAAHTFDHLSPGEAEAQAFEPVGPGYTWGRSYEYCWFRGDFAIPESAAGRRIVMNLAPGGESTLFVNGQAFGTYRADWVNEPHHFYEDNTLVRSAEGGEKFHLLMETYAGHYYFSADQGSQAVGPVLPGEYSNPLEEGKRRVLGHCTYGVWNEDAYQLWMDVMTLASLLTVLDPDSLRAAKIADALEQFTMTVDFEQGREERTQSYREARRLLKPVLETVPAQTRARFYAVGNAHIDLAWLWPLEETHRKTARTFAAQLRLIDEYPEYRYIQSQPALYEMCRRYYPQLFEKIREAVKSGRWIADGAMWVEPDTNMPSGEALVRQVLYGKKYYREMFGVDSRILWLPDTFGYSAALPQILAGCGVGYLVTQKIFWTYNEGDEFPYHYFNWVGMDGTKVTAFLPTSYTYTTDPATIEGVWKQRRQKRDLTAFLLPYGYGDGGGGPTRDYVEYCLRQKQLEGGEQVVMAGPMDFFKDMEAEGGPKPTWTGELYFSAHRGTYTTQALVKKLNRRCEFALHNVEFLSVLAAQRGLPYPKEQIEELWKEVLLHQFHDILPGSGIRKIYEETHEAHRKVLEACGRLEAQALEALSLKPAAGTAAADGQGSAASVINTLGFPRNGIVSLPPRFAEGAVTAEGRRVHVQKAADGTVLADVELPAFGSAVLLPSPDSAENSAAAESAVSESAGLIVLNVQDGTAQYILENSKVRAAVSGRGEITSFVLKESGREFAAEPMNRLRLYKDVPRTFDAWDIDSNYLEQELPGAADVTVRPAEQGGVLAGVVVSGKIGNSAYTQHISLAENSTRLEISMHVEWNELHRLLKASFPVNVWAEEGINEIQFGYVKRPTHRSRQYDRDRFEVCNHRYSALADESHGAAVLNDSKYGISMNGNCLELTLLRAAASPDFRADNGPQDFTYAFTAWEGSFGQSGVVRQGLALNCAPLVCDGAVGLQTGFTCGCDNVIADTVKAAEDGSGDVIIRLYESQKSSVTAKIGWEGLDGHRVYLCDMLENPIREITPEEGAVTLPFRAFQIQTLRVSAGSKAETV